MTMSKPPCSKICGKAARQSKGRGVKAPSSIRLSPTRIVASKILQAVVAPRGLEPERQARDLDRFRIEVDPIQVPGHDLVEGVDLHRRAQFFEPRQHRRIFLRQPVEGGDEKGSRAAGRIDDRQAAQSFEPSAPKSEFPRRRHSASPKAMLGLQLRATLIKRASDRVLDEKARHHVRRVDDAGRACARKPSAAPGRAPRPASFRCR